jgi:hypothetical protein
MKKLPRLLYRYRALGRPSSDLDSDDPDAIEADSFIKSALYFPSRLQFNDKSDCLVPDMSHIADDQFREVIRQRASEELTELSVADRDLYAERMAKRQTEELSLAQRRSGAAQLQKLEIDFEALVIAGIAAVIMRSPKRRTNPWSNPNR